MEPTNKESSDQPLQTQSSVNATTQPTNSEVSQTITVTPQNEINLPKESIVSPTVGSFSSAIPPTEIKKKSSKLIFFIPLIILVLVAVGVYVMASSSKSEQSQKTATQKSSSNSTSQQKNQATNTNTFKGQLMTLELPADWQAFTKDSSGVKTTYIQPKSASNSETGMIIQGEDNQTENAKNNNPEKYYITAVGGPPAKIITSSTASINNYPAFTEQDSLFEGEPLMWNVVIGNGSSKIWFTYSANDPNAATYTKILQTIHIN